MEEYSENMLADYLMEFRANELDLQKEYGGWSDITEAVDKLLDYLGAGINTSDYERE